MCNRSLCRSSCVQQSAAGSPPFAAWAHGAVLLKVERELVYLGLDEFRLSEESFCFCVSGLSLSGGIHQLFQHRADEEQLVLLRVVHSSRCS